MYLFQITMNYLSLFVKCICLKSEMYFWQYEAVSDSHWQPLTACGSVWHSVAVYISL